MSDACPGEIDVVHAVGHAVPCETEGIPTESVGFNDLRTSLQIFTMYAADKVRLRQVQLVIAAIDKDPFCVKQGSHRPVAQNRRLFYSVYEITGHLH